MQQGYGQQGYPQQGYGMQQPGMQHDLYTNHKSSVASGAVLVLKPQTKGFYLSGVNQH